MEQVSARALAGAVDLKPPAVRARALWGLLKSKSSTGNLGFAGAPRFPVDA